MDSYDDIQIEELQNFDFVAEDLIDLIDEDNKFNINEYINGNYDYWLTVLKLSTKSPKLTHNPLSYSNDWTHS